MMFLYDVQIAWFTKHRTRIPCRTANNCSRATPVLPHRFLVSYLGPTWGKLGPCRGHLGAILGRLGGCLGPPSNLIIKHNKHIPFLTHCWNTYFHFLFTRPCVCLWFSNRTLHRSSSTETLLTCQDRSRDNRLYRKQQHPRTSKNNI